LDVLSAGDNINGPGYNAYNKLSEMWSKNVLNLGTTKFDMAVSSCYDDKFISADAGSPFSVPFVCVINPKGFTGANPTLGFFSWKLGTYVDATPPPEDFVIFIEGD